MRCAQCDSLSLQCVSASPSLLLVLSFVGLSANFCFCILRIITNLKFHSYFADFIISPNETFELEGASICRCPLGSFHSFPSFPLFYPFQEISALWYLPLSPRLCSTISKYVSDFADLVCTLLFSCSHRPVTPSFVRSALIQKYCITIHLAFPIFFPLKRVIYTWKESIRLYRFYFSILFIILFSANDAIYSFLLMIFPLLYSSVVLVKYCPFDIWLSVVHCHQIVTVWLCVCRLCSAWVAYSPSP